MGKTWKRMKNAALLRAVAAYRRRHLPDGKGSRGGASRFLIVSSTGIGDTLWGTPAIYALRKALPDSSIAVLTSDAGQEVLAGNPAIDEIFVFRRGAAGYWRLVRSLMTVRRRGVDAVLFFHASDRILWPLCAFMGAPFLIGLAGQSKGQDEILTAAISLGDEIHWAQARFSLLREVGVNATPGPIRLYLNGKDRERPERLLKETGWGNVPLLVGLHPGSKDPFKQWPEDKFARLGRALENKAGAKIVVTGDAEESALAAKVAGKIPQALSMAGKLSMRETAALIERMSLFITNDTGPMHIAFAVKTPTVALFSPTDPALCGPFRAEGLTAIIRKEKTCPTSCVGKGCVDPVCMDQITVMEVLEEAERLLFRGGR
ncbi:MAG: glycosyl transferase family protein [Deltaproteobacteria bacterium CSP1-8]|jgi:ADP-heptose:LPS heptosyltransferase|nr:MAG: glycosyl transferase family protein [Deltaproteobacteria bacterium CSP1-8]